MTLLWAVITYHERQVQHTVHSGMVHLGHRENTMSVTAEQLSKSGARGKDLDLIIRDQLLVIDNSLLNANRSWGRNIVTVELPLLFSLSGLDTKTAQRIVYTSIIRSLKERGFTVRLLLQTNKTTLFISWKTDLMPEEIKAMNALIQEVIISPQDVESFRTTDPDVAKGSEK